MQRLLRLYNRRVVNVNVNVIAAGILALGPTILIVHLSRHVGVADDDRFKITAITFFADVVSDVLIYFGLHWLANHRPGARRLSEVDEAYRQMSFIRDAATVQVQRIILSPLLYTVAFGTLYGLLHAGWARELASAVGLIAGIFATRILHTVWMLRWERKALEKLRLIKPSPPLDSHASPADARAPLSTTDAMKSEPPSSAPPNSTGLSSTGLSPAGLSPADARAGDDGMQPHPRHDAIKGRPRPAIRP